MSDDKTVTEREAVLREREAYVKGRFEAGKGLDWHARSRCLYPLPTITRPRVVKDPHSADIVWRCDGGVLQYRQGNHEWSMGPGYWYASPERVRLWAELLANPTEEVTE